MPGRNADRAGGGGEWLRREGRRVDAGEQLRAAHEMLSRAGAEAFAERARSELSAHLHKVFAKLGVNSRRELRGALAPSVPS